MIDGLTRGLTLVSRRALTHAPRRSLTRLARIADGRVDTTTLATEYLKTVVAVIGAVVFGEEAEGAEEAEEFAAYPALCIGVGGGSIVMFLESYFPELDIDAVEVDPVVVAAASAMGVDLERGDLERNTYKNEMDINVHCSNC